MARFWELVQRVPRKFSKSMQFKARNLTQSIECRESHQSTLFGLPNELVLNIADFLEIAFQISLSLSCRRFRDLFNQRLTVWRCNIDTRLRFFKCLEPDYPEHLPCQSCGFMFRWAPRLFSGCCCPRIGHHAFMDVWTSYAWFIQGSRNICVSREVIDLILRADERGQQYGLPLSYMGTSGRDHHGIFMDNQARLIGGELVLASRWEAQSESQQDMQSKARLFHAALCLHYWTNVLREKIWEPVEAAVTSAMHLGMPLLSKCQFCETDHELHVQNSAGNGIRIVLKVWRNYGRRHGNRLGNEQIFHREPESRINAEAVSQRDLRAVFGSCD